MRPKLEQNREQGNAAFGKKLFARERFRNQKIIEFLHAANPLFCNILPASLCGSIFCKDSGDWTLAKYRVVNDLGVRI
jgi:hypothetical protein